MSALRSIVYRRSFLNFKHLFSRKQTLAASIQAAIFGQFQTLSNEAKVNNLII